MVADFTDWLTGPDPEQGEHIRLRLRGPEQEVVEAVATAHRETRYGRTVVVFEVEAAR